MTLKAPDSEHLLKIKDYLFSVKNFSHGKIKVMRSTTGLAGGNSKICCIAVTNEIMNTG
jgi:hypothetical protein